MRRIVNGLRWRYEVTACMRILSRMEKALLRDRDRRTITLGLFFYYSVHLLWR